MVSWPLSRTITKEAAIVILIGGILFVMDVYPYYRQNGWPPAVDLVLLGAAVTTAMLGASRKQLGILLRVVFSGFALVVAGYFSSSISQHPDVLLLLLVGGGALGIVKAAREWLASPE